jgi:signal transduction histidine kinase
VRLPPMNRVLVALCLLTTIAQSSLAAASSIAADREANVLILNGTDPYFPIYLDIDRAMRASLANQSGARIVLLSEEFDAQHFDEQALEPETLAVLAKKYNGLRIDVVVLVTNSALGFFKRHGERLWPGARVVYQDYTTSVDRTQLPINAIGISPHNDVAATIDVARRMQPNARRILVVSGSSDIDKSAQRLAREYLAATASIGVEFLSGLPLPELLARIAAEPADSIVVYLSQFRDRDGRLYMPRDLLAEITKKSRAPVYGDDETYLGFGILGGSMESYERGGRLVAEQVQAAIAGEPIDPSRVLLTAPSRCLADARALRRWSLDERRLPPGCELRFNDPGYWEKYMRQTVATLVLICAAVVIAMLLTQLRRRRLAERELRSHLIDTTHASRLAIAGELTASIAHEIRQPLAAILSNTETAEFLLESEGDVREALRPILADIRRDDIRASEVTWRLRSLLAKHEVEHQPTDLNAVVADVYRAGPTL